MQVSQAGSAVADASLLSAADDIELYKADSHNTQRHPVAVDNNSTAAALYTPPDAAAYGLIEVDPVDTTTSSEQDIRPVCRFFLSAGGCRNGWKCAFKHTQPTCVFFNSHTGCKYGAACRFLHDVSASNDDVCQHAAANGSTPQQQQQQLGLLFDWDATSPSTYDDVLVSAGGAGQGLLLLLGEGDFSFTAALLRRRSGSDAAAGVGVAATSYEQQEQLQQIYPGAVLRERLQHLTALGERCPA